MTQTKVKRGPGRPKGSKNKVKKDANKLVVKRGRGRPKGSKNKILIQEEETYELPYPNPIHESQRIENIRYMVSFYQNPDGTPKTIFNKPKKRGRKPKLDLMDDDSLVKGDLDSDHFVYTDKDVQEELGRMDGFVDMAKNRSRYSDSF